MKRKRFTEKQFVGLLKEHEVGGTATDICRRHGISEQTFSPLEVEVWRHRGLWHAPPARSGGGERQAEAASCSRPKQT